MQNGDAVFFKRAKVNSKRTTPEVMFKGHGFGILLGHVPPFQKDPPVEHLIRLMGSIGFLSFDDVAEFLGDEQGAAVVKAFEAKYHGVPGVPAPESGQEASVAPEALDVPEPDVEPSKLVGLNGQPIVSSRPPEDCL